MTNKVHKEGREARRQKVLLGLNPYDKAALKDSDEWLCYWSWRNGWMFADGEITRKTGKWEL